jgi:hypothetical protein
LLNGRDVPLKFLAARFIPQGETIEIGTVGSVSAEVFLVEQAFAAATHAYLVRTALGAYRPTHLAVPTTAENHYARSRQSGGNQTQPQEPTGLLFCFSHCNKPSSGLRICSSRELRNGPEVASSERRDGRKSTNSKGTQPRCLTVLLRTPAKRCKLTTYWKYARVGPLPIANIGPAVPLRSAETGEPNFTTAILIG